jgi:hypothetical protein
MNQSHDPILGESPNFDILVLDFEEPCKIGISIMTDPDLHPLPITPNDPLSIVSSKQNLTTLMKFHNRG